MSVNSENQLKFKAGKTDSLIIVKAGVEDLPFGQKHVVHIKQLITGEDHFLPSEGLINKMKEENVDMGDEIIIEKAPTSDKYPYGYFNVEVVKKGDIKPPVHKSVEKFEKQFEKPTEDKLEKHELSVRVQRLETITATLWDDYSNRTSDAGHKPGDEKLPF